MIICTPHPQVPWTIQHNHGDRIPACVLRLRHSRGKNASTSVRAKAGGLADKIMRPNKLCRALSERSGLCDASAPTATAGRRSQSVGPVARCAPRAHRSTAHGVHAGSATPGLAAHISLSGAGDSSVSTGKVGTSPNALSDAMVATYRTIHIADPQSADPPYKAPHVSIPCLKGGGIGALSCRRRRNPRGVPLRQRRRLRTGVQCDRRGAMSSRSPMRALPI
jgi:hypothetical protein